VSKYNIRTSPRDTVARKEGVASYLGTHVMGESGFICGDQRVCRASCDGAFHEGQLHHIGQHYDAYIDDQPFRVVVVGQEYGHPPALVGLKARERMILSSALEHRFVGHDGLPGRNPHMRGTTSLLRLLYGGPPGEDYEGEWITTVDGTKLHVFEAFALVNYLLCSATPEGSSRGQSTRVMKTNCAEHFRRVLEILSPTVLICQGKGFSSWVSKALGGCPIDSEHPLFRFSIGGTQAVGAILNHPSTPRWAHSWGSIKAPYLRQTVLPTINAIRQELSLHPVEW
jgi:hypothetical protein